MPDNTFQKSYIKLLTEIRAKLPDTKILVMRTFLSLKEIPTLAAVNNRIAAGDKNLHFINTQGWIIVNTPDYNDGAPPSSNGQLKAAKQLEQQIQKYLAGR